MKFSLNEAKYLCIKQNGELPTGTESYPFYFDERTGISYRLQSIPGTCVPSIGYRIIGMNACTAISVETYYDK